MQLGVFFAENQGLWVFTEMSAYDDKTKAEIEQMASFICREKGQYMFNKKESGIITGLCKDKVAELCKNIPAACDSRVKIYFIKDVLNYLYNSWLNI